MHVCNTAEHDSSHERGKDVGSAPVLDSVVSALLELVAGMLNPDPSLRLKLPAVQAELTRLTSLCACY